LRSTSPAHREGLTFACQVNIIRDKPETAQEFAACTLKLIEVMRKKFGD
jgi:hypothetical protein